MGEPQPSDGRAQLVAIDHGNDHATVESPWGRLADCRGRLAVHNAIVFAGAFDTLADLQAERAKTAALEEQVAALRPTSGEPTCPLCSLPLRVDWRGITASVLCTPECGYNDRIALQTPQSREAERLLQESFGDVGSLRHQLAMGADKIERLEEEVADLERRLAATRHIPPASRMGWYVCCIVDARGETIASFHVPVPGGAPISEVVCREATHHLQTHVVRGKRPVRYVVIPTTADLCTIGPEVEVRIVEPDGEPVVEVSHE